MMEKFGSQLSIRFYVLTTLLILVATAVLMTYSYLAVVHEQRNDLERALFSLASHLDAMLEGSFEDILASRGALDFPVEEQTHVLNSVLQPILDKACFAYQSYGMGFYDITVDRIVALGPNVLPEMLVQVSRSFPYFESYKTGLPITGISDSSIGWRGEPILYVAHPIIRQAKIIGHTWASVPMKEVHASARRVSIPIFAIGFSTLAFVLLIATTSFRRFKQSLEDIACSLAEGADDSKLTATIPELQPLARTIMEYQEKLRMVSAGEVAASIVHEIRNPFTSIKGFSQLLRLGETDEKRQYYLDTIIQEVDRVNAIITTFLEFSRPASPRALCMSIDDIFTDLNVMVGGLCLEAGVQLTYSTKNPGASVWCDRNQVKQILLNLVQNALQAMDNTHDGNIELESDTIDDKVVIRVKDNGPGIPAEQIGRVFDPFYTTKATGTGLGLSICKQLVINQGGSIAVESRVGVGTIFSITLPTCPVNGKDS